MPFNGKNALKITEHHKVVPVDRVTTLGTVWNSPTFPSWFAALGMLSVTHIVPVLWLSNCMDANMLLTINSFRQLFPDKIFSLTFPWLLVKLLTCPGQLSSSLTFPGFPDKWSPWVQCRLTFRELVFQLCVADRLCRLTHLPHRLLQSPHAADYTAYNPPSTIF